MSETPHLDRRRFCGVAALSVAAGPLGLIRISRSLNAMTDVMPEVTEHAEATDIRPFHNSFSDVEIAELRTRVKATRFPDRELVPDQSCSSRSQQPSAR